MFPRRGLTLIELMMSMSIMAMIAGVVAMLMHAVDVGSQHSRGVSTATQHARVVLHYINQAVSQATATETNPGLVVLETTQDGYTFPDTLVVWSPEGEPANPLGPPLIKELEIYCYDPAAPQRLIKVRAPGDTRTVELEQLNTSAGRSLIEALKTSSGSQQVELTNLLRTAQVSEFSARRRGVLRFERRATPSAEDWTNYLTGTTDWQDLPWPQGIYGSQTGLRQVRLQTELQLVQDPRATGGQVSAAAAIPYFGSAALYYEMNR